MSLCISPEGMTYLTLCVKISDFIPQGESCVAKGKSFSQRRKAAKKMRFMAYGQWELNSILFVKDEIGI